jgi:hypothetical protein
MNHKTCKHCAMEIPQAAKLCPHCRKSTGMTPVVWWLVAAMTLAFVVMCLQSCGGGGGDPIYIPTAPAPTVNVTGTWQGTIVSSVSGSITGTFALAQDGATVTGNYASVRGAVGTISGTVSDNKVTYTITPTQPGCTGSLNGKATVMSSTTMSISYSGTTSCAGDETGTGVITKQ